MQNVVKCWLGLSEQYPGWEQSGVIAGAIADTEQFLTMLGMKGTCSKPVLHLDTCVDCATYDNTADVPELQGTASWKLLLCSANARDR